MANYIFLMDLGNNTILTPDDQHNLIKLTVTGCGFSFVGTMLSLCLICFLPMSSDGMFILSNMSVSLLSAQLAFIGAENAYSEKIICKTTTTILHYMFLSLHCCSLAFGIHLLSKIRPGNLMDKSFKKISVMLICWGLPLVIVGITCAIWGRDYGYGDICWLPEKYGARWAFLGPVAVIQIFNLAVFVTILATRFALDCKKSSKLSTIVGNQVWTFVSMFPVLGLMWIFGFAVTFGQSKFMQYIYVLLASTQGFSIFLCHVMTNSNVRKTLCVKMKPDATDDSVSEGLSEDFTHSSNIVVVGDKESETTRGTLKVNADIERDKRRHSENGFGIKYNSSLLSPESQCRLRYPRHSK